MFSPLFVRSYVDPQEISLRPNDRLAILVGRSNVGKSSLINALAGQPISRTSSTPGRTQTLNLFQLTAQQYLLDLPGYGFAKQAKELRAQLEERIHATLLHFADPTQTHLWLITDASVGLTELDEEMLAFLQTEQRSFVVVANKADKLNQKERAAQEKHYTQSLSSGETLIFTSTKTKEGLSTLLQSLS